MEDQLVRLFIGAFAIIARHRDLDARRDQAAAQRLDPRDHRVRNIDGIGPRTLRDRQAYRGRHRPAIARALGPAPCARLILTRPLRDRRDIAQIDGIAVGRAHRDRRQLLGAADRLPGHDGGCSAALAHRSEREAAVCLPHRIHQRAERDAMRRELCRIGNDAKLFLLPAGDEGQADIVDLRNLGPQPGGERPQRLLVPVAARAGLGRQRQHHDRHIADPAHRHLRRLDALRQLVHIRRQPLVDADCGVVGIGPDQKARGDHHPVVFGLGIDMFDAVDALDDRLQRLADQLHRIARGQAGRGDHQVDHRHADLWFLLARDRHDREQPHHYGGEQHQRRQRTADRRARQPPRQAQAHLPAAPRATAISVSPLLAPDNISTRAGSSVGAIWTGTRDVASLPTMIVK